MSPMRIVSPHTSLSTQVHRALTDMLKNNLRPRTHEEQRDRLRNLVKNREDCEIFLNDQRYVIGRLMSEMENSYGKFSNSVPPAAILCLVDEMYCEIRERYEYLDLSRDVVESWIFKRLHYMYAVFILEHTHTLSLSHTHTLTLSLSLSHTHTHRYENAIENTAKDKTWRDHRNRLRNRNPDPDTFGIDKKIQKRLFGKKGEELEHVVRPVTRILNQANAMHWTPSIVTKLILDASSKVYEVLSTWRECFYHSNDKKNDSIIIARTQQVRATRQVRMMRERDVSPEFKN